MAISWRLKTYLATKHGIFSSTVLQKKIINATGIIISIQNLCKYINKKPVKLPLKTMELICSSLNCSLSDFCNVTSRKYNSKTTKKLSFKNTPSSKRGINNFPAPRNYM